MLHQQSISCTLMIKFVGIEQSQAFGMKIVALVAREADDPVQGLFVRFQAGRFFGAKVAHVTLVAGSPMVLQSHVQVQIVLTEVRKVAHVTREQLPAFFKAKLAVG